MIKRLSTAAICVALVFTVTSVQAAQPEPSVDGHNHTHDAPAAAPATTAANPDAKNVKRVKDDPDAPRKCLSKAAHELLDKVEAQFGPVRVISTCRPGARIAGSGRISRHASGNAVDFEAGNRKGEIIKWLVANHKTGGTMTYPDMSHIHIDIGQHFVSLAGGRKYASSNTGSSRRTRVASASRSYDEPRASRSSRRYTRQASYERGGYERGYASSYYGRGNSDYSNGYATIYR
jgi:uncharacterized protein YcbK (DUF882 family)